jgi:ribosomal protein S18 acetylase RimI-like enzyme
MGRLVPVETARPEDREAALRLLFLHFNATERERRVANALHLMEVGKLAPEGLFIVRELCGMLSRPGRSSSDSGVERGRESMAHGVCAAMTCLPIAGASALVWPPRTRVAADPEAIEDQLIHHAVGWLRQRGAKLGQALLAANEVQLAAPLERNGFRHVTTLWYMRRAVDQPVAIVAKPRLTYRAYDRDDSALFAATLLRTYEGTRDCPEVNGVRTLHEILDGHAADAGPNLERWWLALDGERPAGVLLVNESAEWQAWEVAYVGVVPEVRGLGLGRELMLKAVVEAQAAEAIQLTLCVDARNAPAIALYQQLGFERYDEREVYLAVWQ